MFSNYFFLQYYFNVDKFVGTAVWDGLRAGVEEDCARRYRDRKWQLHKHFEKVGGRENPEEALKHPHHSQTKEAWSDLVRGVFLDPKFIEKSEKNKQNRSQQKYPSTGGSKAYSQSRYEEVIITVIIFQMLLEIFQMLLEIFLFFHRFKQRESPTF